MKREKGMERRAGWLVGYILAGHRLRSWPQLNERGLLACLPACQCLLLCTELLLLPVFSSIRGK